MPPDFAACTILSKNYLAYARVVAESFRRHHPDAPMLVLLVDRIDGHFAPEREPFEVVPVSDLEIPDFPRFSFQYNIHELNTAAKPYFLRYLLQQRGVARLLYLDPDIVVFRELARLRELLADHSILLTPHLARPADEDGRRPGERHILESGVYNLGFIGVRNDATVAAFLDWWAGRLYTQCVDLPGTGLFLDQRWVDLVPGLFDGVHIVRDPGYNVAYWNLRSRTLEIRDGEVFVNGLPLHFFHFSGLDLEELERISKYQDRFVLDDLPHLRRLFEDYRERLMAAGYAETREWPYAFGSFDNGVPVPGEARRMYWRLGDAAQRFGDPFSTGHPGSFWEWLNEEVQPGSGISRLWHHLYSIRPDVQQTLPDVFGADRPRFVEWLRDYARPHYRIPDAFALPPDAARADATAPAAGRPAPTRPGLNVAGDRGAETPTGEALRATLAALSAARIPHTVLDVPEPERAARERTPPAHPPDRPHPINLVHVNPEAFPHFVHTLGARAVLLGRYNVGYWVWERPELPAVFHGSFAYLDEVWVPNTQVLETVSRVSPVPVVKIPIALPPDGLVTKRVGREHFGLPVGPLIFLVFCDARGTLTPANPSGAIQAFRQAFKADEDVRLVLALQHGDHRARETFRGEAANPRLALLDRPFERAEVNALIEASDCYVSLHRFEAVGRTIAAAMALGRPVIATACSADLDFPDPANSLLVRYDPVRLERDDGPFPAGSVLAEPDIGHAAELMRLVYENRQLAREVAQRGMRDVRRILSPEAVGDRIARRVELIAERLDA